MHSISERQLQLRNALEKRGITDPRVLDAIRWTRRDLFVPPDLEARSYDDEALPIGEGQTISQPYIVALMTQALAPQPSHRVLEIGTGSGYQTAILAGLCREVVTVERIGALSHGARRVLSELGLRNIQFAEGDGTLGWPDGAPYDGIIVTAAPPDLPAPLYHQLREGGRLVIPVGGLERQMLQLVENRGGKPSVHNLCECRFVKLIGAAGWAEES